MGENIVKNLKDIEKILIEVSLKIAKQGKGCLFIIKEKKLDYEPLIEQDIKPFSILDNKNKRRLELLALHDGACIIDLSGNLIAYAVNIKNVKTLRGWGTKHSAGYSSSLLGNTAIVTSEEEKKVRVFKNGEMVQIDALEKNIEKKVSEISNILESVGVSALGGVGAYYIGMIGVTALSGVIVFGGGAYYLLKKLDESSNKIGDFFKRWERK